jgi:proteasome lid subunit RPN8/RPN11
MRIRLTPALLHAIQANGEDGYPLERAGLLIGKSTSKGSEITEIVELENSFEKSSQAYRYSLDPLTFFDAEEEAENRGLDVVGIFHSHPDHPARPSAYDLEWALPHYGYLITSVVQGKADETRAWQLAPDRGRFEEAQLDIMQTDPEGE